MNVRRVELFKNRIRGGHGTLIIDNRSSGGVYEERETLTCCHCNCIVVLEPKRIRPREFCLKCNAYVCDAKECIENCYSMQRSLELVTANPEIPALPRTKDGGLLFNPELLTKGKPF